MKKNYCDSDGICNVHIDVCVFSKNLYCGCMFEGVDTGDKYKPFECTNKEARKEAGVK